MTTPGEPRAPAPGHAHAWASMRFELDAGRPWVVETCAGCGSVRRYRAFERHWDGTPSADGGVAGGAEVPTRR